MFKLLQSYIHYNEVYKLPSEIIGFEKFSLFHCAFPAGSHLPVHSGTAFAGLEAAAAAAAAAGIQLEMHHTNSTKRFKSGAADDHNSSAGGGGCSSSHKPVTLEGSLFLLLLWDKYWLRERASLKLGL